MHRFYLPAEHCQGPVLRLSERDAHHAPDVLRLRKDDEVTVLDGAGAVMDCRITDAHRKQGSLTVVSKKLTPPPPCPITLVQAIPKGKLIEDIIQKATELGTARIVPLLTERVTTQLDRDAALDKQDRKSTRLNSSH